MTVATAAACGTMAARIFYCDLLDCRVGIILRSINTLQPPWLTAVGIFHNRDGDLLIYFVSLIFFRRDTCWKIFARIGIILLCAYTDNATGTNNICYIMASHRIEYRSAEVRCSYLVYYYVPRRSRRCRCSIAFDKYLQLRLSVKILNIF